jgi:N-formylmaleamate deformylase
MTYRHSFPRHWMSGSCEANAINIHYLRTGGDKPALVCLHGLMGDGACWAPLARSLERDHDVLMPDARGHGRSSAPAHGYTYLDLGKDVVGLIDALEITAPILLGHSMGSMTAAGVASQLGAAVRGVVLADPTFISPEWQREVYESDIVDQHRTFVSSARGELLALSRLRHPDRPPEIIDLITDARLQIHIKALDVLTPPNPDYRDLVRNVRAPTLLVLACRGVVSLETACELQNINPCLRPDAGCWPWASL